MTRYILNYPGGAKGDFLCKFINKNVDDMYIFKKRRYELPDICWEAIDNHLKNLPNIKIFPTHTSHLIPTSLLEKNNLKIINLKFDHKFIKTIMIEGTFNSVINGKVNYINIFSSFKDQFSKEELKKIRYYIDVSLLQKKLEINDENRCKELRFILKNLDNKIFLLKQKYKKNNRLLLGEFNEDDRGEYLDYKEIFIDKKFNKLNTFFKFDQLKFSKLIDQSWLPEEIKLWNCTWIPSLYGYQNE